MKAYKESETRYYKYEYSTFVQPTLTSQSSPEMSVAISYSKNNNTYGNVYQAFSPNTGSVGFYCNEYKGSMSIYISFPNPVKLTNISFKIPYKERPSGRAENIKLYANSSVIKNIGTVAENASYSGSIENSNYYNSYMLYVENGGWAEEDRVDISNILLVGEVRKTVKGTAQDYDYKIEGGKTYVVKEENVRKYYKYITWEQPILSSNGTMGGYNFACTQSNSLNSTTVAWRVFNGDSTTTGESNRWQINNIDTSSWYWLSWYNPNPIMLKGLTIYNSESTYVVKAYKIQGSNDNSNWTDIVTGTNTNTTELGSWQIDMSNNTTSYPYFRIYCQPNNSTSMQISEIQINAKAVVESTAEDYDFYEDVDIYKALKTYEKGQYYGN